MKLTGTHKELHENRKAAEEYIRQLIPNTPKNFPVRAIIKLNYKFDDNGIYPTYCYGWYIGDFVNERRITLLKKGGVNNQRVKDSVDYWIKKQKHDDMLREVSEKNIKLLAASNVPVIEGLKIQPSRDTEDSYRVFFRPALSATMTLKQISQLKGMENDVNKIKKRFLTP